MNRKLSVVLNLSEASDYRGGQLQVKNPWGEVLPIEGARKRGTIVVFPSTVLHTSNPSRVGRAGLWLAGRWGPTCAEPHQSSACSSAIRRAGSSSPSQLRRLAARCG
jgi:hypothetical protein